MFLEIRWSGRNRSSAMLVDREYVNGSGEVTKAKGLSYNPFVKTKMLGVLATVFRTQATWV